MKFVSKRILRIVLAELADQAAAVIPMPEDLQVEIYRAWAIVGKPGSIKREKAVL